MHCCGQIESLSLLLKDVTPNLTQVGAIPVGRTTGLPLISKIGVGFTHIVQAGPVVQRKFAGLPRTKRSDVRKLFSPCSNQ